MPPKLTKQQDKDALKLLEEKKKQEEEELKKKQEDEKKFAVQTLPTGLQLILTQFYIEQALPAPDCIAITKDYLKTVFERDNIFQNFRPVDIQNLSEQIVYDLVYSSIECNFDNITTQIFINIMYSVYKNLNKKFIIYDQSPTQIRIQKTQDNDWIYFKLLLKQHSQNDQNCIKYFNAQQLDNIINYAKRTYFSHWQLINYIQKTNQRPLELFVDLQIEKPPQDLPSLDSALKYIPSVEKKLNEEKRTITPQEEKKPEDIEQENQEMVEPTDEDLLDPYIMDMIRQRLQAASNLMEQKLLDRHQELQDKLADLNSKKDSKKGKK